MKRITQPLLIGLGSLCVGLGVIGIFVPVMPTTVFFLLAAYFYARSSQRFYDRLLNNRWFGAYIRNYRAGRGIPLRQKVFTLVVLWLTLGYTGIFVVTSLWVRLILALVAVGVTVHLVMIKTYRAEEDTIKSAPEASAGEA
jgi:uncharacterized membrane protein YbaN (DUF454 family)